VKRVKTVERPHLPARACHSGGAVNGHHIIFQSLESATDDSDMEGCQTQEKRIAASHGIFFTAYQTV